MDLDRDPKAMARRLRAALTDSGVHLGHSQCLELVAKAYGLRDWNTLAAAPPGELLGAATAAIPVLRIFGRDPAYEFYVDGLGFQLESEQGRADLHEPVRMLVSCDGARLQLTEHNDDTSPGGAALIWVRDVTARHAELERTGVVQALSAVEQSPTGPVLVVVDPFRNRLVFHEGGVVGDTSVAGPIRHDVTVRCDPHDAFAIFTGQIGTWWPPDGYSPGPLRDVRIEPGVGGAVIMELADGSRYQWGTVVTWEPGRRYRQTFTLAQDADHPSELDLIFTADGDRTTVHFAHGGWTAGNLDRRSGFRDWSLILDRYVTLANGGRPD